jgi:hypothetical protein
MTTVTVGDLAYLRDHVTAIQEIHALAGALQMFTSLADREGLFTDSRLRDLLGRVTVLPLNEMSTVDVGDRDVVWVSSHWSALDTVRSLAGLLAELVDFADDESISLGEGMCELAATVGGWPSVRRAALVSDGVSRAGVHPTAEQNTPKA